MYQLNNGNELYHHGVKGMKWGVRRNRTGFASDGKSKGREILERSSGLRTKPKKKPTGVLVDGADAYPKRKPLDTKATVKSLKSAAKTDKGRKVAKRVIKTAAIGGVVVGAGLALRPVVKAGANYIALLSIANAALKGFNEAAAKG